MQALRADLEAALPLIWGRPVASIFLGGGTPSLMSPEALSEWLSYVRALLPLLPDCEITLEANPGTFEQARFSAFAQAGVTRLSLGVQSLDDAHLRVLGRVHDSAQARAALLHVAKTFANFNIDLMYALPGQTLEGLRAELDAVLAVNPPNLSVYHLTIEPNTVFAQRPPTLPDDDTASAMLDCITDRTASVGLERYEVSAYARTGRACRHNLNYWHFGDYLGVGAGAHSKLTLPDGRIVRHQRVRDPARYMEAALQVQATTQERDVAGVELAFEFMLNALRLRQGFPLALFRERTGLALRALEPGLTLAVQRGLLLRDATHIRPTERGFDFLNDLLALFLPPDSTAP